MVELALVGANHQLTFGWLAAFMFLLPSTRRRPHPGSRQLLPTLGPGKRPVRQNLRLGQPVLAQPLRPNRPLPPHRPPPRRKQTVPRNRLFRPGPGAALWLFRDEPMGQTRQCSYQKMALGELEKYRGSME